MKSILLILSALLIFSCTKNSSKNRLISILMEYQPSEQVFEIDSEGFVSIVGKKGTKININTEDLVFEDGEKIEFPIKIALLELTSKEDLMRANAQTVSNGRWLVSGGAYKIQITSNGRQLKLKEGSSYTISFPKIVDERMSIFYGERNKEGNMNWESSEINLDEREYPIVIKQDSSFMRYDLEYNIDLQVDTVVLRKPKGKFKISQLSERFPYIDSISIAKDTIFGISHMAEEVPVDTVLQRSIELNNRIWKIQNQVYEAISLNKLGWINVDRFYPKISNRVNLSFLIDKKVWNNQCFISSQSDNLIMNQYLDETGNLSIDFPKGKTFQIFVFGLEDDKLYGCKKSFRTTEKSRVIKLKMKEIGVQEIEDYLKLD